jgi:hypothetical protein
MLSAMGPAKILIAPATGLFLVWCVSAPGCAPALRDTPALSPAASRPQLQDEFLDHLIGDWRITRTMHKGTSENTMHAKWVLGHQFVLVHMIDVQRPPAYEAIVLIGFDSAKPRYIAHWCDTFGGAYSADGLGVRQGDTVEFRFTYDDGPFFNTFTWHPQTRTWTFRGENGRPDGSRELFMEDEASRVK